MVYSTRSNRPLVSTKKLKTSRVQSEHSKKLSQFVSTHKVSVRTDRNGKINVQGRNS